MSTIQEEVQGRSEVPEKKEERDERRRKKHVSLGQRVFL
jgi:hypothetical protein